MLATGLLPLDTEMAPRVAPPVTLPALPPVKPPPAVESKLSAALLPPVAPPPTNPTGTQRLVEDGPQKSQGEKTLSSHSFPSSPSSTEPHPRKQAVEEEKAAQLGLRPAEAASLPAARPANQRRSSHTFKLFLVLLFIMVGCFAAFAGYLYNFFQKNIEPYLGTSRAVAVAPPQVWEKPSEELKAALAEANNKLAKMQTEIDALRAQQSTTDEKLETFTPLPPPLKAEPPPSTQLTLADGQISRLQAQVNELRTQQSDIDAKVQEIAATPAPKPEEDKSPALLAAATERLDRLQSQLDIATAEQAKNTELLRELSEKPPPVDKPEKTSQSPSLPTSPAAISTVVTVNSDTGQELRILKERNRLTLYADQALANASAEAMANLWRSLRDPELAFVKDGVVAEIVRVQHFYGSIRGLPASYRLPVTELFKDGSVPTEADLKDEQAIHLLVDPAQPPEIRTRVAAFLAGHKTKEVGDALVEAMRHDNNLLVVKTAQNTLQENFELYEPRLFDAIGMEKAWQEKREKLQGEPQKPEAGVPK
ncbi:MAG: hypothetical protein JWO89_2015 [Verrucomicrobiaceae bacterium]|nr:hypothetical protein [Verrucomicrobiaceae bacterium]